MLFIPSNINIKFISNSILIKSGDNKISSVKVNSSSLTNLRTQLIGQSIGYCFRLSFVGIGYRVESIEDKVIKIKLGFSHFIFIQVPLEVTCVSPKKTSLIIRSANPFVLSNFLSEIYQLNGVKKDPYKGKGIRLKNQFIPLKEGKKK